MPLELLPQGGRAPGGFPEAPKGGAGDRRPLPHIGKEITLIKVKMRQPMEQKSVIKTL